MKDSERKAFKKEKTICHSSTETIALKSPKIGEVPFSSSPSPYSQQRSNSNGHLYSHQDYTVKNIAYRESEQLSFLESLDSYISVLRANEVQTGKILPIVEVSDADNQIENQNGNGNGNGNGNENQNENQNEN